MRAQADNVPSRRSVLERVLIRSWEYRHLRFWVGYRIAVGSILLFFGILTLAYRSYGWAAVFLVPAALNFAFAYWELAIARSAAA
jgi:hypothetical protein